MSASGEREEGHQSLKTMSQRSPSLVVLRQLWEPTNKAGSRGGCPCGLQAKASSKKITKSSGAAELQD